jgi:gamma-glutamyltranspeptidase/glutathione hydrolase
MAEQYDLRSMGHNSAAYVHTLVGIKKLAYRERDRFVTDPAFSEIPLDRMLSKAFARDLLAELGPPTSGELSDSAPRDGSGDTVFLCVIDRDGNSVSMIQSLFAAFGSGRMVPGTGILLHNRGALFSLDTTHVNVVAPRKRTFHTLAPSLALRPDGSLFMLFGTPGGDGQPQTLLQVFNNVTVFGMSPQRAVEAPRFRSHDGDRLQIEPGIPEDVRAALAAYGHRIDVTDRPSSDLGGAQLILIDARSGVKFAAADPRREAYAIAW